MPLHAHTTFARETRIERQREWWEAVRGSDGGVKKNGARKGERARGRGGEGERKREKTTSIENYGIRRVKERASQVWRGSLETRGSGVSARA